MAVNYGVEIFLHVAAWPLGRTENWIDFSEREAKKKPLKTSAKEGKLLKRKKFVIALVVGVLIGTSYVPSCKRKVEGEDKGPEAVEQAPSIKQKESRVLTEKGVFVHYASSVNMFVVESEAGKKRVVFQVSDSTKLLGRKSLEELVERKDRVVVSYIKTKTFSVAKSIKVE